MSKNTEKTVKTKVFSRTPETENRETAIVAPESAPVPDPITWEVEAMKDGVRIIARNSKSVVWRGPIESDEVTAWRKLGRGEYHPKQFFTRFV